MTILLLPSVYYYDVIDQVQAKLNPIVEQAESSMNIKRKRSKKGKAKKKCSSERDVCLVIYEISLLQFQVAIVLYM